MNAVYKAARIVVAIASLAFVAKSLLSQWTHGAEYHRLLDAFPSGKHRHKDKLRAAKRDEDLTLEFVHIPKTGGTSILFAAAKAGIPWGHCKFSRLQGCSPLSRYSDVRLENRTDWACNMTTNTTTVDPWHCPMNQFRRGDNMYDGSTTFTIVRNPYDRIVSEYYWAHSWFKPGRSLNKPKMMNAWIRKELDQVERSGVCVLGHCIPMHKYTHNGEGDPIVDHVLHLENIKIELPILLKEYGLQRRIRMGHKNVRRKSDKLDSSDLTDETVLKINHWAALDFEYFGYDMIVPSNVTSG